ncbi:DUF167 domain-containing protein [Cardinium endosymbiont of Oedothorax gibbosus]|uniref:DUF167 domain-containing protein n=1 Tax=Cardinium endosymbiont of Oedothorax gibbosus TaxID=931101 RepID=UPI0020252003|nr:DUF167 domain-containing protein [Cardinium endosymbiont of Oedothorax gibbosus]CAH2559903.1 Protein of unknown function DUF167 [Cardinium endosymbiont of Oedothorax gibbosus]
MTIFSTSAYFLHIYAKPKSHQDKLEYWIKEGNKYILQLRIMAPPEGVKANKAIIALLAKTLDIAKSNITLISGATARHKTFKIAPWSALLAEKLPKRTLLPTLF